ncbi:unnamed protein product [Amoebophrya sp. A120]|nr:unnamed protein product [Amoebophrya sp. A120]|eukprot:GSA120T00018509001.1
MRSGRTHLKKSHNHEEICSARREFKTTMLKTSIFVQWVRVLAHSVWIMSRFAPLVHHMTYLQRACQVVLPFHSVLNHEAVRANRQQPSLYSSSGAAKHDEQEEEQLYHHPSPSEDVDGIADGASKQADSSEALRSSSPSSFIAGRRAFVRSVQSETDDAQDLDHHSLYFSAEAEPRIVSDDDRGSSGSSIRTPLSTTRDGAIAKTAPSTFLFQDDSGVEDVEVDKVDTKSGRPVLRLLVPPGGNSEDNDEAEQGAKDSSIGRTYGRPSGFSSLSEVQAGTREDVETGKQATTSPTSASLCGNEICDFVIGANPVAEQLRSANQSAAVTVVPRLPVRKRSSPVGIFDFGRQRSSVQRWRNCGQESKLDACGGGATLRLLPGNVAAVSGSRARLFGCRCCRACGAACRPASTATALRGSGFLRLRHGGYFEQNRKGGAVFHRSR